MSANNDGKECDLYICASYMNGCTVDWLQERTKSGYLLRLSKLAVERFGKAPNKTVFDEDTINQEQAERLYDVIVSLL